jgi:hypothetical protein
MSFSVEQNESGVVVIVDGPLSECYPEVENEMQSLLARENESIELELRSDKFASIDIGALLRLYELTRTQGGKLKFSCGPKVRRTLLSLMGPQPDDADEGLADCVTASSDAANR